MRGRDGAEPKEIGWRVVSLRGAEDEWSRGREWRESSESFGILRYQAAAAAAANWEAVAPAGTARAECATALHVSSNLNAIYQVSSVVSESIVPCELHPQVTASWGRLSAPTSPGCCSGWLSSHHPTPSLFTVSEPRRHSLARGNLWVGTAGPRARRKSTQLSASRVKRYS